MERLDVVYKTGAAAIGAVVGYLFGGWSELLGILLAFVVMDYVTGVMAAYREGSLRSAVGFKRIPKKVMIFMLVAVGHLIDRAVGTNGLFRDATIFFYLANELLSIIENAGRIGLPVPEQIKQAVEVLKGKSEKGESQK
ncbi:holin [Geobacillus sp. 46C-IIa]|uniref:phage holin family protein n=1 Tax=Geobacillus sp. 46C-IIa TaxID=1963025 RepID=UPI0009BF60DE|nr:phage holin family protein [Geobacillus sp. 46C-IIa]OQP07031.1 holin [Geobacillus sp. 46C-IIa]QNU27423.1 phage holin family protein [Geobacillus sp. 46C-IIa]